MWDFGQTQHDHSNGIHNVYIAANKTFFSREKSIEFSYFLTKTYIVGTQKKRFAGVLLMSTIW